MVFLSYMNGLKTVLSRFFHGIVIQNAVIKLLLNSFDKQQMVSLSYTKGLKNAVFQNWPGRCVRGKPDL